MPMQIQSETRTKLVELLGNFSEKVGDYSMQQNSAAIEEMVDKLLETFAIRLITKN